MRISGLAIAGLLLAGPAGAQQATIFSEMDRIHPVWAENGMVSAQERLAAEIGRE